MILRAIGQFKSCFPHQTNIIRTNCSLWATGSDFSVLPLLLLRKQMHQMRGILRYLRTRMDVFAALVYHQAAIIWSGKRKARTKK